MSYTTMLGLYPGTAREAEEIRQFSNAWGAAPHVWDALASGWLGARPTPLWHLARDPKLSVHERAVLAMTFDRSFIAAAHYAKAATDIRKFLEQHPAPVGHANHWPEIAEILSAGLGFPAVGFWMTSVSENLWHGDYDPDRDIFRPYDWSVAEEVYSIINTEVER